MSISILPVDKTINAVDKLANTVGKGVGYIRKPKHVKKMAGAYSEALGIFNKSPDEYDITIENGAFSLVPKKGKPTNKLTVKIQELIQHGIDEKFKESFPNLLAEKENLENIIDSAFKILESCKEQASPDPIDENWLGFFYDKAKSVSKKDAQLLWATILAKETVNPNSFSKATLQKLLELEQAEANLFIKFAKASFRYGQTRVLVSDEKSLNDIYNIGGLVKIMELEEINLVHSEIKFITIKPGDSVELIKKNIFYKIKNDKDSDYQIGIYKMTNIGKQLCTLFHDDKEFSDEELKSIFKPDDKLKISIHQGVDEYRYVTTPIRTL